jgi:hypothetical protein
MSRENKKLETLSLIHAKWAGSIKVIRRVIYSMLCETQTMKTRIKKLTRFRLDKMKIRRDQNKYGSLNPIDPDYLNRDIYDHACTLSILKSKLGAHIEDVENHFDKLKNYHTELQLIKTQMNNL